MSTRMVRGRVLSPDGVGGRLSGREGEAVWGVGKEARSRGMERLVRRLRVDILVVVVAGCDDVV